MTGGIVSPANAFAAQANEYAWLNSREAFTTRLRFLRLYSHSTDDSNLEAPPDEEEVEATVHHLQRESRLFREGTTVFVTAEVMDLVNEAAEEMPGEVLMAQDMPLENFVMWFEEPLPYHPLVLRSDTGEPASEEWNLDAIGIEFIPDGIMVKDMPDLDPERVQPTIGNRVVVLRSGEGSPVPTVDGILVYAYVSRDHIPMGIELVYDAIGPYGLIDMIGVGFDVDWTQRTIDGPARQLHKWLIAMMRLMGEHIELRRAGMARPLRRAAERAGRTLPKDGYLSIMHLRRVSYGHSSLGESVSVRKLRWRHRVRGHWQSFYCSSRKLPVGDPGAYRHRYVNAYVRGPQEAPVRESHRVVVVDR